MVAGYQFDVKNIDIWVPAFFEHNNSFIATVRFFVLENKNSRPYEHGHF